MVPFINFLSKNPVFPQDGNEVIRLANGQVLHLDVRDDIRENDEALGFLGP